ncbi:DNA mismatch repair endonuclease MutL [Anaerococcus porci]|uniref:DNA mismatch repair endonuclease MutL n=1 Tax=Anaerococcus porci TaxID=2652269 RepID=UPI002A76528B|nr:DNA mismatch repair endonuclease MutL [Anaerococcus porci]MDY3005488.1 DNA mismatch repair endonuclease MutL [Anaerococcus porci]
MAIVQLDKNTIEKIAAGEVIESPLSIVKELVENSIDAKAKNIVVEIKNGGKSYIRVTDDGTGIEEYELELAFKRHATSKINTFDDLYNIFTLGFRGEALSSILACADLTLISCTKNSKVGKKVVYKNNKLIHKSSIATNIGTSIEVYNLFKNIPVRRKFLASDIRESNRISRLIHAFALGYDGISFKFIKDDRFIFHTLENQNLISKIYNLIDENLKDELIHLEIKNNLYEISGYTSSINYYRGNRSLQYIFINNRLVEYKKISNSIEDTYSGLIPNSRYPAFFIFINTNSNNVDVNIHPNKREIKLSYEDELLSLIKENIGKKVIENVSSKEIKIKNEKSKELNFYEDYSDILNAYNKINDSSIVKEDNYNSQDFYNFFNKKDVESENNITNMEDNYIQESINSHEESKLVKQNIFDISKIIYKSSLFGKYSLFEYNDKLLLLNHRRAEQRLKFEKYIKDFKNQEIVSQQLLDPIIMKININDYSKYIENKDLFKKLGFDIEEFSSDKLIIRSLPLIFDIPEKINFFYELLDLNFNDEDLFYDKISKIINNISFKKGDRINEDEANELINGLNKLDNPYKTFDGKTILISISESEMEKYFER